MHCNIIVLCLLIGLVKCIRACVNVCNLSKLMISICTTDTIKTATEKQQPSLCLSLSLHYTLNESLLSGSAAVATR